MQKLIVLARTSNKSYPKKINEALYHLKNLKSSYVDERYLCYDVDKKELIGCNKIITISKWAATPRVFKNFINSANEIFTMPLGTTIKPHRMIDLITDANK